MGAGRRVRFVAMFIVVVLAMLPMPAAASGNEGCTALWSAVADIEYDVSLDGLSSGVVAAPGGSSPGTGDASAMSSAGTERAGLRPADELYAPRGGSVDFAHETSPGSAQSIVADGLSESAGAASTAGGLYARPGSFHTFAVSPDDARGLQLSYEMGL